MHGYVSSVFYLKGKVVPFTQGPAYNEQFDAQKSVCSNRVLVVTKLFNIGVNDRLLTQQKLSAHSSRVLFVTELVVSGTLCSTQFLTLKKTMFNKFCL